MGMLDPKQLIFDGEERRANVVCERIFVTNGWKSGVVWSGRRGRIHWCIQIAMAEKQTEFS